MTTAFVFAGGGSLGAVEVGMLKALVGAGVEADFVVGASVGAINAAYFAADPSPAGVARLEAIWRGLRRSDVFPLAPFGGLWGLLRRRDHLVDPAALGRLLERHLPYQRLEDAALPCHVVATRVFDGAEVCLSAGSAVEALLASAAIPGVFPPAHFDGHWLIDGGVANNTPLSTAIALGAHRVIVLPSGIPCALDAPPRGAIASALHALNLLIARQLLGEVDRHAAHAAVLIVPPLCPLAVSSYDFDAAGELIDRAAAGTAQWLRDGGLERPGAVPHELTLHWDQALGLSSA